MAFSLFMAVSKTKITNYAGMTQSMGAVFSICYENDRVIMDFGSGFNPEISNYIKKDDNWIKDKLDLGLLPKIDYLYPEEYINGYDLKPYKPEVYNTAIFVSHLHLDHMSNIGAVHWDVPVYMSENARKLEYTLEEIGQGVDSINREYSVFENMQYVEVGKIKVLPIMNSPYSYNMYGFLIETPDCFIGYTADLSLCNEKPDMVLQEMEIFKERKLDLLYCDNCNFTDSVMQKLYGTLDPLEIPVDERIPEGMLSFDQHYDKISRYYLEAPGLVVFNHYQREMLDAYKILQWAQTSHRKAVFEPDAAYLIWKFYNKDVDVYLNDNVDDIPWFSAMKSHCRIITREDILKEPERYYLHISYRNIDELFRLKVHNGTYIHAEGDPFSSREIAIMKDKVHATGYQFRNYDDEYYFQHGYPNMIRYFVDQIDPKVVIGYHGFYPERIPAKNGINLVPELYKVYHFENDRMVKEES